MAAATVVSPRISPQAPTHVLIVPNRVIPTVNDVTADDEAALGRLFTVAARLAVEERDEASHHELRMPGTAAEVPAAADPEAAVFAVALPVGRELTAEAGLATRTEELGHGLVAEVGSREGTGGTVRDGAPYGRSDAKQPYPGAVDLPRPVYNRPPLRQDA